MKQKIINKYCIGCGLCQSVQDFSGRVDEDGFWRPEIEKKDNLDFFESVCPMSRTSFEKLDTNSIWGKYEKLYLGYASEKEIRTHASSGGVLTALCIYLLEKNIIDGVLHTKVSDSSCIETTNCCSDSKEKLMDACGSRYSILCTFPFLSIAVTFPGQPSPRYVREAQFSSSTSKLFNNF